tara:strand:+ start:308 stop:985 length:678 start_codon:yes stop_codon:yes gene_type:complete
MKLSSLVSIVICIFSHNVFAQKLKLVCDAFDYNIEIRLAVPLQEGMIRFVNQTNAGFLDSDTYSQRILTDCDGKGDERVCLINADSNYCSKPSSDFKFRSLREDNSIVMISDRCEGNWTKYQKVNEGDGKPGNPMAFFEHSSYFQLKNQIYAGVRIQKDKPMLLLTETENTSFSAQLVSFKKDLWSVNIYDPLRKGSNAMKVSLESYENNIHHSYSLNSSCRPKS